MAHEHYDELPDGCIPVPPEETWPARLTYIGIDFATVESDRYVVKDFVREPYPDDILKILSDNSVKEIARLEDEGFIRELSKLYKEVYPEMGVQRMAEDPLYEEAKKMYSEEAYKTFGLPKEFLQIGTATGSSGAMAVRSIIDLVKTIS
jgi:hypothetical protein